MQTRTNSASVNLEDYFQVAPFRAAIPHRHCSRFDLRIKNSSTVLRLLVGLLGSLAQMRVCPVSNGAPNAHKRARSAPDSPPRTGGFYAYPTMSNQS